MDKKSVTKLWFGIGVVLSFYAINTWLSSQGANPFLSITLLDDRRAVGALFGIFICSPLAILLSSIGEMFIEKFGGQGWPERIPVVWLETLDTSTREGRLYQGVLLFLFVVLPALSLLHFFNVVVGTEIRDTTACSPLRFWDVVCPEGDRYRFGERGGVTFFPIVEPIMVLALFLYAEFRVCRYLRVIFKSSMPERNKSEAAT